MNKMKYRIIFCILITFMCFGRIYYMYYTNLNRSHSISNLNNAEITETIYLTDGVMYFTKIKNIYEQKIVTPDGNEVRWINSQVMDYFGTDVFNTMYIPSKMELCNPESEHTVYIDSNGKITYDNINYMFANSGDYAKGPWISFTISKGKMPISDEVYVTSDNKISKINDVEFSIKYVNKEYFLAQIEYGGIGYHIKSFKVSQEEFEKIILSIIKN